MVQRLSTTTQQFQSEPSIASEFCKENYKNQSLEEIVKNLVTATQKLQQETDIYTQNLTGNTTQLSSSINNEVSSLNNLKGQCELPIETTDDPAHDVNVVTLKIDDLLKLPDGTTVFRHGYVESTMMLIKVSKKVETQLLNSDPIFISEDRLNYPKNSVEYMKDENEKAMKEIQKS